MFAQMIGLGAALFVAQPETAPEPAAAEQLAWLAGSWEARHVQAQGAPTAWTEEHWTRPRGGILLGIGRRGQGARLGMFEFMAIRPGADGVLTLVARPDGEGEGTPFRLVRSGPADALFENPAHDYPQRIRYRRAGAQLIATISRLDGSGERSWTFDPQPARDQAARD